MHAHIYAGNNGKSVNLFYPTYSAKCLHHCSPLSGFILIRKQTAFSMYWINSGSFPGSALQWDVFSALARRLTFLLSDKGRISQTTFWISPWLIELSQFYITYWIYIYIYIYIYGVLCKYTRTLKIYASAKVREKLHDQLSAEEEIIANNSKPDRFCSLNKCSVSLYIC